MTNNTTPFKDGQFGLVRTWDRHWLIVWSENTALVEGDRLVASGTYDAVQAARRLMGDSP